MKYRSLLAAILLVVSTTTAFPLGTTSSLLLLRHRIAGTSTASPPIVATTMPTSPRPRGQLWSLQESNAKEDEQPAIASKDGVDYAAMGKYLVAISVQMGLLTATLKGLDFVTAALKIRIPFVVNALFFYFLALKSRIFNPMSNQRPQPSTKEVSNSTVPQRIMPTWTPPGFVFPIVWLLLIGPLRAVTSAMIVRATGGVYTSRAILALLLHLSIGDVWNSINNVERRYGTSVLGMVAVWTSAALAAREFGRVLPVAGWLLAAKLLWLTVAASLIVRTWQLNPTTNSNGRLAPILPRKSDGETKLIWFES